eukprot:10281-Heterococcus_DN1.PRE.7
MHVPARRRKALRLALHVPIASLVLSNQGSLLLLGHTSLPSHSPALYRHKTKGDISITWQPRSARKQQQHPQALVLCYTA